MKLDKLTALAVFISLTLASSSTHAGWLEDGKELLKGIESAKGKKKELSTGEIARGLKEALRVGSDNVVTRLGKKNGYNKDPKIHIPLPEKLKKVRKVLKKIGKEEMADDLELRLNRAAENAAPRARDIFIGAIKAMTIEDAKKIYNGGDDSATRYFREKMTPPLKKEFSPVIRDSLGKVGAIKSYEKMVGRYKSLPFVPDVREDLTEYVTGKGIDGIFHYLAKEEAAIRKDPVKRTTELLRKVFGR